MNEELSETKKIIKYVFNEILDWALVGALFLIAVMIFELGE